MSDAYKAALEREIAEVGKRAGLRAALEGATSDEQRAAANAAEAKAREQAQNALPGEVRAAFERVARYDDCKGRSPPPPIMLMQPSRDLGLDLIFTNASPVDDATRAEFEAAIAEALRAEIAERPVAFTDANIARLLDVIVGVVTASPIPGITTHEKTSDDLARETHEARSTAWRTLLRR